MEKKAVVLQIFTGGYEEDKVTYEEIEGKLMPILERIPVEKVIMGWSSKAELYCKTKELLQKYGTQLYVWLPVFSETGLCKPIQRLVDYKGKEVRSYHLKEGENFEFYCPNVELNTESFLEIYEENFSTIPFDGVFLDKIRYGSFSNGRSGVFNCFCPNCLEKYSRAGLDVDKLKAEMQKVEEGKAFYRTLPLKVKNYKKGIYEFEEKIWEEFFTLKGIFVTEAVTKIADYFHKKNMLVGMDTFAPFTAYFAGQNIEKLAKSADFIKPMMYRITKAPAGLPFECSNFLKETVLEDKEAEEAFYQILQCKKEEDGKFDLEFVKRELENMTKYGTDIYCGIEMNRMEEIAPVNPEYVEENLQELAVTDSKGYVMSWDLLSAPEENIQSLLRHFDRIGG